MRSKTEFQALTLPHFHNILTLILPEEATVEAATPTLLFYMLEIDPDKGKKCGWSTIVGADQRSQITYVLNEAKWPVTD